MKTKREWPPTVWRMFECDRGARWTTVQDYDKDGSVCWFSGCQQDHAIHFRGETSDREIAGNWFRRP